MNFIIALIKADKIDNTNYDFVHCPSCKARLCDKPIGAKATTLKIEGSKLNNLSHIILRCQKCKNKYLISIDD